MQEQEDGYQGGEELSSNFNTNDSVINDDTVITNLTDTTSNNGTGGSENQMPEEPPVLWLVYDGNMIPSYGEEITVYIYSDANLMIMDLVATISGDANFTGAMSQQECADYGWDSFFGSDPYIDPEGWIEITDLSASAFFEGKEVNGTVGYLKFRYYTGQVSISISTSSWIVDNNVESRAFSTEPLILSDSNQ